MDIFSVFTLCGGLAFFLYGMTVMSKSLEKMAGGKLERMLKRMTSSPFKSLLLGAGITIAIQSSSAMTVMLVGLVNSGVMELRQTIGIIMGPNIGTTLTAWILSLTGIESQNVFVNLLKPENFSPLIALAGILLIMGSKRQRRRDVGRIMMGFAILMYGMELMSGAVSPLAEMPQFAGLLTAFENPLLGVLVGAVFTGIIQSSAASVAILQALAMTGSITYGMAIPIIMGQTIGTCVTALISSIGVNRNAKRVAVVHISFNVIGTAVCLILFYGGDMILHFTFLNQAVGAVGIAFCHTAFNVFTTILLLPFSRQLEKLARRLVRTETPARASPSWIPCCCGPRRGSQRKRRHGRPHGTSRPGEHLPGDGPALPVQPGAGDPDPAERGQAGHLRGPAQQLPGGDLPARAVHAGHAHSFPLAPRHRDFQRSKKPCRKTSRSPPRSSTTRSSGSLTAPGKSCRCCSPRWMTSWT